MVTTTAPRNGSRDPPDGVGDTAGSVAVDTSGDAEGAGFGTWVDEGVDGDELHPQTRTAAIKDDLGTVVAQGHPALRGGCTAWARPPLRTRRYSSRGGSVTSARHGPCFHAGETHRSCLCYFGRGFAHVSVTQIPSQAPATAPRSPCVTHRMPTSRPDAEAGRWPPSDSRAGAGCDLRVSHHDDQAPICQAASSWLSEPSTRSRNTGLTRRRLRARIASRHDFPSASIRRATYALAGGWKRDWVTAIT